MLLLGLLILVQTPDFDAIARARDITKLKSLCDKAVLDVPRALDFLTKPGPYDVGRFGWNAVVVNDPTQPKTYVVFTTKLTSEDIGDQVFELQGGRLVRKFSEAATRGVTIASHDFNLAFEPKAKTVVATDRIRLKKSDQAQSSFLMRFSPCYKVVDIEDAQGKRVKFTQGGGVVFAATPSTSPVDYTVKYRGVVDLPQYAASINENEVLLSNDYWYPMIGRLPANYTLTATVPASWTVVAQGDLVSESTSGTRKTAKFKMDLPTVYFSFSAGPFKTLTVKKPNREYTVWSTVASQADMAVQNEVNADVLDFYSNSFGDYPFKRWGVMETDLYGGGALEAYSYATYGTGWLPAIDAHEPSHTWWGGIIPNSYLKSFWNESFADYSSGLYVRESPIGNIQEKRLAYVSDASPSPQYNAAPPASAGADLGSAAVGIGYGKGSKVLQMLEQELGVPTMIATMREWVKSHPKNQLGEWEDYETVVNRVAKRDMGWFFDQWIRRAGWADFDISKVEWKDGKIWAEAKFTGDPYSILCDTMVEFSDGTREFGNVRIAPQGVFATFAFPCAKKPVLVSFDPWRRLLRRYDGNETPVSIERFIRRAKRYSDPAHKDWLRWARTDGKVDTLPTDLSDTFIVGSPESVPAMADLCKRVGFEVHGNQLAYKGTTIDLRGGMALAVVELGGGKRCAIGLGTGDLPPNLGRASLVVTDRYGRPLRAQTNPKTAGFLTYRL